MKRDANSITGEGDRTLVVWLILKIGGTLNVGDKPHKA